MPGFHGMSQSPNTPASEQSLEEGEKGDGGGLQFVGNCGTLRSLMFGDKVLD